MSLTAGVVAVQGNTRAHTAAFEALSVESGREIDVEIVRAAGIIPDCDFVALPGGESTTISRLIQQQGLALELRDHVEANKPLLATCAGLIVISNGVDDERVQTLDLLDIDIERNAFGRQRDSFEVPLSVVGLEEPFPGIFIRAPRITDSRDTTVLSTFEDDVVAIRSGPITATSFHPELAGDSRLHRLAFADQL